MKYTAKVRIAVGKLLKLDVQQRDKILADIDRADLANRVIAKAGKLKRVRSVENHKIVKAFGSAPKSKKRPARRGDGEPDKQT